MIGKRHRPQILTTLPSFGWLASFMSAPTRLLLAVAFLSVFLPGIRKGLTTAIVIVFIPMLGSYVVPELVGGADGQMIGNKIAQRDFSDRNLPAASALAAVLTLVVLAPVLFRRKDRP